MITLEETFIGLELNEDQVEEHNLEINDDITFQTQTIPPFLFKG